jgi:hypothetical protein
MSTFLSSYNFVQSKQIPDEPKRIYQACWPQQFGVP